MTDMLFWVVNLSSFDNFVRKKNLGSNGLSWQLQQTIFKASMKII